MPRNQVHYTRQQVKLFLGERFPSVDWDEVVEALPPIIWRARWNKLAERLGLPFTRGYMQNLDSQGEGPASFEAEGVQS